MKKQFNKKEFLDGFNLGVYISENYSFLEELYLDMSELSHNRDSVKRIGHDLERGIDVLKGLYEKRSELSSKYSKDFLDESEIGKKLDDLISKLEKVHCGLCYDYSFPNESIDFSSFSVRLKNCLQNAKIERINQLTNMSINELMRIRGFGGTCMREMSSWLEKRNLKLRDLR